MQKQLKIRLANKDDCNSILSIYQYYVLNTAITFEYDVPSLVEIETRMANIQIKYPYLVAEVNNKIVGYAYATDFRHKAAYQWSPESTIYLDKGFKNQGIGKILYQNLIDILQLQGYFNVFGGVALPNEGSIALHRALGFKTIGTYENIGYKNGKWHSTCWFQLGIGDYNVIPQAPININLIPFATIQSLLVSD